MRNVRFMQVESYTIVWKDGKIFDFTLKPIFFDRMLSLCGKTVSAYASDVAFEHINVNEHGHLVDFFYT